MNRGSPSKSNISQIALGDLTNRLGKGGFSLISRSPASKRGVGTDRTAVKENDPPLAKRISLVDKKPQGAKCPESAANADKSLPLLKGGKTYRLRSCAVYSQSVSKCDHEISGMSQDPEQLQAEPLLETLGSQTASNDGMDSGFSSMPSSEGSQFMGSRLAKLPSSIPFELERCMLLKGDAMATSAEGADSLESCSCSFCIKAAHIWSELHYMDAKGRMSALVKSKKEASNLVRLCSLDNGIGMGRGRRSFSRSPSSELEFDLMNQSKSLFVSMEKMFGMEYSQLENKFSSLKDIRESFKMNLIDQKPP